jgi:hypothetical protein
MFSHSLGPRRVRGVRELLLLLLLLQECPMVCCERGSVGRWVAGWVWKNGCLRMEACMVSCVGMGYHECGGVIANENMLTGFCKGCLLPVAHPHAGAGSEM